MANVYIEARPKGLPHGSRVEDYVVEDYADHVLQIFQDAARGHRLGTQAGSSSTRRTRAALERQERSRSLAGGLTIWRLG